MTFVSLLGTFNSVTLSISESDPGPGKFEIFSEGFQHGESP